MPLAPLCRPLLLTALVGLAAGCATPPAEVATDGARPAPSLTLWPAAVPADQAPPGTWEHFRLPGKRPTEFTAARVDGRDAMAAVSSSAASMVRQRVRVEPADLGRVRFSWKVADLIQTADMAERDTDDSPVRIVLAFEGDRSKFSARNVMLNELSRAITGEEMPYATLMYVWCNQRPAGSVILNPRTDRIRKLVVESGAAQVRQWVDYERDVRADYVKAFGEEPGALVGIAVMTDTDNTRSKVRAWYGPIRLDRPLATAAR